VWSARNKAAAKLKQENSYILTGISKDLIIFFWRKGRLFRFFFICLTNLNTFDGGGVRAEGVNDEILKAITEI